MISRNTALVIVDMQKYYLSTESQYYKYFNINHPGSLDYILDRSNSIVIPNILKLLEVFRNNSLPIIYLRLCSLKEDRSDLHRFFKETNDAGKESGFENIYPCDTDPFSLIINELQPQPSDIVLIKQTFSPFNSTNINNILQEHEIKSLVMTGLATSQCVETTARDASDNGIDIIHIEDAQTDYDELTHNSSLFSSRGVCGGMIYLTDDFLHIMK